MTSNFSFLESEFPWLYEELIEAENFVFKKPKFAALQCRIALEKGLNWLYDNDPDYTRPYDKSLSSLLHDTSFRHDVPDSLFRLLNLTRKYGNNGAHGNKVKAEEALVALKSLFTFSQFLSRYYSSDYVQIPPFDENLIPKADQKEKDATIKELQARIEASENYLKEARQKIDVQQRQIEANTALKAQYIKQQAKVVSRKNKRKKIAPKVIILTSEAKTRKLLIDVLLQEAGWKDFKYRRDTEFEVKGMPVSTNPTGIGYVDYVLWGDDGKPLAVVEAKKTMVDASAGRHQAKLYANCLEEMYLQRPVIFYSNGYTTYLWDDTFCGEREVSGFYTKEELLFLISQRDSREDIREFQIDETITERPYQLTAIKRVAEAFVTKKDNRLVGKDRKALLVMATGSGKTRTSASIVDMLTKCNWAKRILFLADRNALVTQAKNAFKEHLPHLSAIDLTKEKEDDGTRLVFSTYPTIMNKIDDLKSTDGRFYTPGHFDLIIIDEAHRSVYKKYKAIFDYFDSYLIGLTATPKNDIDHNTYSLFDIEDDIPTYAYELNQAVADGYLLPPKAIDVPIKFLRKGVKYKDLTPKEREQYDELFDFSGTPDEAPDIGSAQINKFLFNSNTVDKGLDWLMQNGIKVNGGDKLGKTIIFAKNHKHAEFIRKRFLKNYPQLGADFLEVIDNYQSKAQDLLERFCEDKVELNPQIAVSVDMMDTGVDAPRVVNLVFFKEVFSYSKYWQMIGRGTRLRPDLFAPGRDKEHFLVFDYCGVFDFFDEHPDGVKASSAVSLSQKIFNAKLNLVSTIRNNGGSSTYEDLFAKELTDELHASIKELKEDRFAVRQQLRLVHKFKIRDNWDALSVGDITDITNHLSHLSVSKGEDELAKRFDLVTLNFQLALVKGSSLDNYISRIHDIATQLIKKRHIAAVGNKIDFLKKVTSPNYWKTINLEAITELRIELRDLIKFLEVENITPVYSDFQDEIPKKEVKERDILPVYTRLQSYKDRLEAFIRKNKNDLVIDKLYKNVPITVTELEHLESLVFNKEIGSKADFEREYGNVDLGRFIRSIVGLDIKVVNLLFADFINEKQLNTQQITFVQTLINYLNKNGVLDKSLLVKPPFNNHHQDGIFGVFPDENDVIFIRNVIDQVNTIIA